MQVSSTRIGGGETTEDRLLWRGTNQEAREPLGRDGVKQWRRWVRLPTIPDESTSGHRVRRACSEPSATVRQTMIRFGLVASALALALLCSPVAASAQQGHAHSGSHQHGNQRGASSEAQSASTPLREPGNAAFAAIQEVLEVLRTRADTDWTRVDMEALRQHLVDMERFTLEAVVLEQETIEGGLRVVVRGTSPAASSSIRSALSAHAPMLEAERGWTAEARPADPGEHGEDATVLEVTAGSASDSAEVEEIRGLGYIGLMATGVHHTAHHWMIATGRQPHAH